MLSTLYAVDDQGIRLAQQDLLWAILAILFRVAVVLSIVLWVWHLSKKKPPRPPEKD